MIIFNFSSDRPTFRENGVARGYFEPCGRRQFGPFSVCLLHFLLFSFSFRFDLICSCVLSNDLTIDLSLDVWDEVAEKLQFYEPKKNSGEIGGFNYAVVTLKNLLESDACEETSLAEVLSNSAMPLETEKHK